MNSVVDASFGGETLKRDSVKTVIFASMIGTAIEFLISMLMEPLLLLIFRRSSFLKLHRQLLLF
ncbi:hypothetical protein NBRC111894_4378 [Sporolactobacillus inulinus]|uniref:Uncharacterized protein n=1 Tax=Sporolactobacillus inulinus TaxID=2078 RepID=A0A4Y1ZIS4_9BACL|nr:hypothetical protein [Sporolactobacillus inulinus]GAY78824.1 hypothetical protein NBRC111894_4378 [Sporolactobacillus inulinus]